VLCCASDGGDVGSVGEGIVTELSEAPPEGLELTGGEKGLAEDVEERIAESSTLTSGT